MHLQITHCVDHYNWFHQYLTMNSRFSSIFNASLQKHLILVSLKFVETTSQNINEKKNTNQSRSRTILTIFSLYGKESFSRWLLFGVNESSFVKHFIPKKIYNAWWLINTFLLWSMRLFFGTWKLDNKRKHLFL